MSATLLDKPAASAPRARGTRREATRRRILEAATRLFARDGLTGTTSVAIARGAGVATGTFYLHFPDKHALFDEIVTTTLADLRQRQERAWADRDADCDELRCALEVLVDFTRERRDLIRVAFERGAESAAVAHRIQDDVAGRVEAALRRQAEHESLPIHPAAAAQARAATLIRVIAWWAEDPARATREEIIETLYHLAPSRLARAAAERPPTRSRS